MPLMLHAEQAQSNVRAMMLKVWCLKHIHTVEQPALANILGRGKPVVWQTATHQSPVSDAQQSGAHRSEAVCS